MSFMMEAVNGNQGGAMPESTGPETGGLGMAMSYRIKRMGARPLVFQGTELAMAMSFTPELPYWYEINLFRTTDQHFVLAIKLFYQSANEKDTAQVWKYETIDQALDTLETYDAGQDVRVTVNPADTSLTAAELAAYAMDLSAKTKAARAHYAGLAGEFLHEIEQPN
jgi:hypothetical protein